MVLSSAFEPLRQWLKIPTNCVLFLDAIIATPHRCGKARFHKGLDWLRLCSLELLLPTAVAETSSRDSDEFD